MRIPLGVTTLHLSGKQVLLLFLALGFVGHNAYGYVQQSRAVSDATAVRATVDETDIVRDASGRENIEWIPEVRYTYQYRGSTYRSEQVYPGVEARGYYDRSKAVSVTDSYEPGATVTAYVRPDQPSNAFLIRERGSGPLWGMGIGVLGVVVTLLAGLGSRTAGQAEPRPVDDVRLASSDRRSWVQRNGGTVRRLAKRLAGASLGGLVLSLVVTVFAVLDATSGSERPQPEISADLFGPVGLPLLAVFACYLGLVLSTCLYGGWSVSEYRQVRRRLEDPKPPSPFRHPSRLVTIIGTSHDELSEYGQRVRVTGVLLTVAGFLVAVLLVVFVNAG
jgi:hypothetical protein